MIQKKVLSFENCNIESPLDEIEGPMPDEDDSETEDTGGWTLDINDFIGQDDSEEDEAADFSDSGSDADELVSPSVLESDSSVSSSTILPPDNLEDAGTTTEEDDSDYEDDATHERLRQIFDTWNESYCLHTVKLTSVQDNCLNLLTEQNDISLKRLQDNLNDFNKTLEGFKEKRRRLDEPE